MCAFRLSLELSPGMASPLSAESVTEGMFSGGLESLSSGHSWDSPQLQWFGSLAGKAIQLLFTGTCLLKHAIAAGIDFSEQPPGFYTIL